LESSLWRTIRLFDQVRGKLGIGFSMAAILQGCGATLVMARIRKLTRTAACLLLFVALLQYRSFENVPVAGRWSYPYAAFVIVVGLLLAASLGDALGLRRGREPAHRTSLRGWYFELAFLVWAASRLISALDDSTSAGSLLDLVFIGSWTPIAVVLDWCALSVGCFAGAVFLWPSGRRLRKLALLGGSILFIVLVAEGIARGKAILCPEPQGFPTLSHKIWSRRYVKVNSHGFRDREQALSPSSGSRRLLVVGDSIAHGTGINDPNDRFGERLAGILRGRTSLDWELTTAAEGNTHTMHHLGFLTTMLPRKPDVVVLVYTFNDIDYITPVTIHDPLAEVPASILNRFDIARVLYSNFYAFQELFVRMRLLYYEYRHRGHVAPQLASPYFNDSLLDRHMEDLKRFVASASQSASVVTIVPFDATVAFLSDSRAQYRRFVEAARRVDLPVLSIESAFDGYRREQLTINALDAHPNERAHALAAEASGAMMVASIVREELRRASEKAPY
jgi:lysophospholipase L1-like esterase